jgi:hypothetical protein
VLPDDPAPSPGPRPPFRFLELLVPPLSSDPGPGGMSCSCFRAGLWWVGASKSLACQQVSCALPLVPMSVETFWRLGALTLTLLGDLADQAVHAGGSGLSRAAFLSGALRELSVALCRGNTARFYGCGMQQREAKKLSSTGQGCQMTKQAACLDLITTRTLTLVRGPGDGFPCYRASWRIQ